MCSPMTHILDSCVDEVTLGFMLERNAESVHTLRKAWQILGIPTDVSSRDTLRYVYPVWQFYRTRDQLQTIPGIVEVWETLRLYNIPGILAAYFLTSPNEWMMGNRPIDILRSRAQMAVPGEYGDVIAAARNFGKTAQEPTRKA